LQYVLEDSAGLIGPFPFSGETMKFALIAAAVLAAAAPAFALEGTTGIHDPSNVVECEGKLYTFGTGNAALVSEDGWTWSAGTRPPGGGLAPDLIKLGDRYFLYIPD